MQTFIHGFMGDRTDAPDGYDAIDLPFHGNAPTVADWDAAVEYVAEQLVHSTAVLAYSMGGRLALGAAQRYPTLISSLTLIAAHPGLPNDEREHRLNVDFERATQLERDPERFSQTWSELPMFGPRRGDRWDRYGRRTHHPERWAAGLRVMSVGHQPNYADLFEEMDITYIVGQFDTKYVALSQTLRAKVLEVPNAWHAVHRDQPELLKAILD